MAILERFFEKGLGGAHDVGRTTWCWISGSVCRIRSEQARVRNLISRYSVVIRKNGNVLSGPVDLNLAARTGTVCCVAFAGGIVDVALA